MPQHFGKEHGLLCLERAIPEEVLRGLRLLAGAAAPFKAETLHSWAEGEDWLNTLTDPLFFGATSDIPPCSKSLSQNNNGLQEEELEGEDAGGGRRADLRRKRLSSPNNEVGGGELLVVQDSENSVEALRWLKADVKRIARIFAREVSSDARCGGWFKAGKEEGERMDVTVKLELLKKGKCPRFHLDKVIKVRVFL